MEKVRFACPRCQTIMQTGAEKVGYDVACPHCAHRFRLVESGEATSSGHRSPTTSNDETTLPPTAFPPTSRSVPAGSTGAYSPERSDPYGTPNPVKPAQHGFDASKTSHVVNPYSPVGQQAAFCCPYCQTTRPPIWKSEVSQIGWIVFAILLVTTCVFCFVGLFIRDKYRICSQCKIRLS